ncbi:UNVERIFIED_CONTAM: hypothetical protein FKN15_014317 [Acipenser sinensis]
MYYLQKLNLTFYFFCSISLFGSQGKRIGLTSFSDAMTLVPGRELTNGIVDACIACVMESALLPHSVALSSRVSLELFSGKRPSHRRLNSLLPQNLFRFNTVMLPVLQR